MREAAVDALRPNMAPGNDQRLVDARVGRHRAEQQNKKAQVEMWKATVDALRAYVAPGNDQPFPKEVAADLMFALDELIVTGSLPVTLGSLLRITNSDKPTLVRDKVDGVRYILAAKAGWIVDKNPEKTIMDWFGVAYRKTIFNWTHRYKDEASVKNFRPDDPMDEGEKEAVWRGQLITDLARISGKHWQENRPKRQRGKLGVGDSRTQTSRAPLSTLLLE